MAPRSSTSDTPSSTHPTSRRPWPGVSSRYRSELERSRARGRVEEPRKIGYCCVCSLYCLNPLSSLRSFNNPCDLACARTHSYMGRDHSRPETCTLGIMDRVDSQGPLLLVTC
jgi:hypothetical protein